MKKQRSPVQQGLRPPKRLRPPEAAKNAKQRQLSNRLRGGLLIAFLWAAIGAFQATYDHAILASYDVSPCLDTYIVLLLSNMPTVFVAGFLAGFLLLPMVNSWLRTHTYGAALLLSLLGIAILYSLTSLAGSLIYNSLRLDVSIFDRAILPSVYDYLTGMENLKNFLFWLLVAVTTTLALQVNDKYGPGVFRAFLLGRYFHPRTEERTFMFLDIRSSTTVAEQLEELQYFEFVKDFFQDVTPGILLAKGEIYQYVGDEVVVSWPQARALKGNNCVQAFFEIRKSIAGRASLYQERYGIVPSFKAGLHCGTVVSGEIGAIKRDIAYSGDVLNTAARIQSKCNEMGVDILLSETLLRQLALPASGLREKPVGEVELRGKAQAMRLYTVEADSDGPPSGGL